MSVYNEKLCMGCMSPMNDEQTQCDKCGYCINEPYSLDFIPPNTQYNDKYIFGKVISSDSEGALYIGYDTNSHKKIFIKEFSPLSLCTRNHSDLSLIPKQNCEVKYKALLGDFEELYYSLKKLGECQCIIPILDIFKKNNTVYVVIKYIKAVSLSQYLQYNGGYIEWGEAKQLFRNLVTTLCTLQEENILHRGISPDTIFIDQDEKLYLTNFSISSNRTKFSEIEATLFEGFSAPEQYEANGWQGDWTDVYGICATLYRTITGTRPPRIMLNGCSEKIIEPNSLNYNIPKNVSDAIVNGMEIDTKKRTQNMSVFISEILECTQENTAIYNVGENKIKSEYENEYNEKEVKMVKNRHNKTTKKNNGLFKIILLITIISVIVLGVLTVGLYGIFVNESEKTDSKAKEETVQTQKYIVPLFKNQRLSTVLTNKSYDRMFNIKVIHEFNSEVEDGIIYKQSPSRDEEVEQGSEVVLYVSKGANILIVPDLIEKQIPDAIKVLDELGIKYQFKEIEDENREANIIYQTEPIAGVKIDVDETAIILYIAKDMNEHQLEGQSQTDTTTQDENKDEMANDIIE